MTRGRHTDIRYGILALILLIGSVIAGLYLLNKNDAARESRMAQRERAAFLRDSIEHDIEKKAEQREKWAAEKVKREKQKQERERLRLALDTITITLHPFDPNTADSSEFVHLGLQPWMGHSIENYRTKGGKFRKPEDFRRVYGMTDSLYSTLEPYITIKPTNDTAGISNQRQYASRIKKDTILQLNTTDTAELQMLRGVGRYTAQQIISYRDRLGGYVSKEQIREIPNLRNVDSILLYLSTDSLVIKPLYINKRSVDVMARHPYLNFEQARAINLFRHKHGTIKNFEQLMTIKENGKFLFTASDTILLHPYLSFSE